MSEAPRPLTEAERRAAVQLIDTASLYLVTYSAEARGWCRRRLAELCRELATVEDRRVAPLRMAVEMIEVQLPDQERHATMRMRIALEAVLARRAGLTP